MKAEILSIFIPTKDFDGTIRLLTDIMGFSVTDIETSEHDEYFLKSCTIGTPNGVVLKVIENNPKADAINDPVVSITVSNLERVRLNLLNSGIYIFADNFDHQTGVIWFYCRSPDGTVFQFCSFPSLHTPKKMIDCKEGIEWILIPSTKFDATVVFFENILGFAIEESGVPVVDLQYNRYATFKMSNGVILEVVEPISVFTERYNGPVVSLSVLNLRNMILKLKNHGCEFLTDIKNPDGIGWTYFDSPAGITFQLQGP